MMDSLIAALAAESCCHLSKAAGNTFSYFLHARWESTNRQKLQ